VLSVPIWASLLIDFDGQVVCKDPCSLDGVPVPS
jgi:hypothetical protein